jgi:hypothetical protein
MESNGKRLSNNFFANDFFKANSKHFLIEQNQDIETTLQIKNYNSRQVYSITYTMSYLERNIIFESYYDFDDFKKILTVIDKGTVNQSTYYYNNYKQFGDLILPETVIREVGSSSGYVTKNILTADYIFNEDIFHLKKNSTLENLANNYNNDDSVRISNIASISSTESQPYSHNSTVGTTVNYNQNAVSEENYNKREQAYQSILENNTSTGTNAKGYTSSSNSTVESSGSRERISRMDAANAGKLKYRRSSLYTLMLDDNMREHNQVIKNAFGNTELSEKFNDHNIGPYLIPAHGQTGEKDQSIIIEDYLNRNKVAKNLVAKWFNRDAKGHFDMDLVASRGQYNASELDIKLAKNSLRGKALLSDMGKELINNTFVVVYDYKYTNKEESAAKRRGLLSIASSVASYIPGASDVANVATVATLGSEVIGKGYYVRTTSYLYRLVWNDDIAQMFFEKMWVDKDNYDNYKKSLFENTSLFRLEYVGSEVSRNNLQSTIFTSNNNEQLIEIATIDAVDKNIGKLQRTYEQFRVKTPLLSTEPLAAQIGLKEGLEKNDVFEVLEQNLAEDGTTYYKRVGTIKVDKNNIWDNTYSAKQSGVYTGMPYTIFKGNAKKFAPGMLIRQIK